jgi:hypothetical protein
MKGNYFVYDHDGHHSLRGMSSIYDCGPVMQQSKTTTLGQITTTSVNPRRCNLR